MKILPVSKSRTSIVSDDETTSRPSKRRRLADASQHSALGVEATHLASLLCDRCQAIDFEKLFTAHKLTKDGKPIMVLDDLPESPEDATCPVCRLFSTVCSRDPRFKKYHLRMFDSIRILSIKRVAQLESNNLLAVVPGPMSRKFQKITNRSLIHRGLISQLSSTTLQPGAMIYRSRMVQSAAVAFPELNGWLKECLGWHKECHRRPTHIANMKLIDCLDLRIVTMEPGFEYYALSYVWGKVKISVQSMSEPSKNDLLLSGRLQRTIADAIKVVLKLGCRYLWVDQFCIGEDEKSSQVQQMDKIYEGAIATIVAAAGDDAESGLAGVSYNREFNQDSVSVGSFCIASTMPHLSYFLQNSKWRTRAWTYQEAMLSRRIFFFTEAQVYFVCKSTTYCESVQQSTLHMPSEAKPNPGMTLGPSMFRSESAMGSKTSTNDFFGQLREYSHRSLTHEGDALDAFKGLLARAEFMSYWGIPLYLTRPNASSLYRPSEGRDYHSKLTRIDLRDIQDVSGFVQGLTWTCAAQARKKNQQPVYRSDYRREVSCPSWSWASLRRHARYFDHEPFADLTSLKSDEHQRPEHKVTVELVDRSQRRFQDLIGTEDFENVHIIPEQSRWIHITGQHIQVTLESKDNDSANEVPSSHTAVLGDVKQLNSSRKVCSAWIDSDLMMVADGNPDPRLTRQTWTAVELYQKPKDVTAIARLGAGTTARVGGATASAGMELELDSRSWWMLLDECEGGYHRIGVMRSWGYVGLDWPVQTFRIG